MAVRWVLALAFVAAAAAATWAELRDATALEVEVDVGYGLPELGDAYNVVFDRLWFADVDVVVRTPRRCARGVVTLRQNGRVVDSERAWSAAREARVDSTAYAQGGTTAELTATASCRAGPAAGLNGRAAASFAVPRTACAARALRVLELDGVAHADGAELEEGDRLPAGTPVRVERGRVVVGAPECNGFHALLRPGETAIGGYDPNGRGDEFRGPRIVVPRADDHAGGWSPFDLGVRVFPEGARCAECPLPRPASFAARSGRGRAAIRVYAANVLVGSFNARYVRVRAGQQLFVRCAANGQRCRFGRPVLFQPREPFTLVPRERRRLRRMIVGRRRPSAFMLAPERARTRVYAVRAAGGEPALLAVLWDRGVRTAAYARPQTQHGLIVWRQTRRGWRLAYARRGSRSLPYVGVRLGDVTHDGHQDVLMTEGSGGSGGCGIRRVIASARGDLREIFRRAMCETEIEARGGDLVVPEPIGPCPDPGGAAHCFGGTRTETWRWNGSRLLNVSTVVRCVEPRLDPVRDCRPRR